MSDGTMNENEVAQEIGKRIRQWRLNTPPPKTRRKRQNETGWRPHMTIEELAKATGLTVTTVNKLELGYKAPRIESLLLLSQAFGCDPSELLPKTKHRNSGKSELLNELAAAANQLGAKQLRELIKQARGMEPG
ncbi:helix-turn-helix domain-containing protein [Nannocystis pusilla]|uniref:Helix-turn-helix domain-containing protein n=3 Tax=Nannocystaceae TaxID=224463 RepID=A0ABS7TXR3_9BACT|nr:helix-turn-helix transcriptional regulator [Nannocystis pusilla]MBZ5713047.1 helix-turn-helix domain-containing protein [Nannocystis pusilla]MDC0671689.1 helix-turn-helix transcriptional regulator [Nannocystis radixulma]